MTILAAIRRWLLALLAFGLFASALDLVLLEHYEDWWQLLPLAVIAVSLAAIGWHVAGGGAASIRALRWSMLASTVSGLVGVVLHFRGNMSFQLDMDPAMGGWELFTKVMHAKAPPAMAPGAMVQLGLLGLIYTFRHPGIEPSAGSPDSVPHTGA
jgi:hypothetical protein